MGEKSKVLFSIFGILDVTGEVVTMWIILAVIAILSLIVKKNLKERPGKFQNIIETGVEYLDEKTVKIGASVFDISTPEFVMGVAFDIKPMLISSITRSMKNICIVGEVFAYTSEANRAGDKFNVSFGIFDGSASIFVKRYSLDVDAEKELGSTIKNGMVIAIRGYSKEERNDATELYMNINDVAVISKKKRKDNAEKKRVELHLHTNMSSMDALIPPDVAVKTARNYVHVLAAVVNAVHTHLGVGHIRAVKHTFRSDRVDQSFHGVVINVRGEIVVEIFGLLDDVKGVTDVFINVGSADVGNDDLRIRVSFVDLRHLRKVDGIFQSHRARDVENDDAAEVVHHLKMLVGKEIKNSDLGGGDVGRAVCLIGLDSEVTLRHRIDNVALGGLVGRAVKSVRALILDEIGDVAVDFIEIAGGRTHNKRGHFFAGEDVARGLGDVFVGHIGRNELGPGDATLALLGLFALHTVGPDVRVRVDYLVGQKIREFFFVNFLIVICKLYSKHYCSPY